MTREAWGKFDREEDKFHPLSHHCMDVAAVFAAMTQLPVIRDRLQTAAGGPLSTTDGAVTVTGWCQLRVASSFLL